MTQTPIKDYIEESKKLFDEKLTQYDKDGGFIVYIEGEDCTDFDTDLMLKFLTSRQEGLLEVARGMLEEMKESNICTHYQDKCSCLNAHDTQVHNKVLSQAQEILKIKE